MMKREWFSIFVSSPKLISFIFFIRWFFDLGVDMIMLVVYNSVCQQGFGHPC